MLHGIGATLMRRLGPGRVRVHPHVSAFAIACARLGWPDGRRRARQRRRTSAGGARALAAARPAHRRLRLRLGWGERRGARAARARLRLAAAWSCSSSSAAQASASRRALPRSGGSVRSARSTASRWSAARSPEPRACRASPGCRTTRTSTTASSPSGPSAPSRSRRSSRRPGLLLWDVGAGSGSIGIEWLRAEPTARAVAIEARADRAERAARNALALGVPQLVDPDGRGACGARRALGARCDLRRRRADVARTARSLLGGPAARRAAGRQRRHARERARAGRRSGGARRRAHAHRRQPGRAASAASRPGARSCRSCSGASRKELA